MANLIGPPVVEAARGPIQDLDALPDDGYRYEIFDGSLLVTPPARGAARRTTLTELRRLLERQTPDDCRCRQTLRRQA